MSRSGSERRKLRKNHEVIEATSVVRTDNLDRYVGLDSQLRKLGMKKKPCRLEKQAVRSFGIEADSKGLPIEKIGKIVAQRADRPIDNAGNLYGNRRDEMIRRHGRNGVFVPGFVPNEDGSFRPIRGKAVSDLTKVV